MDQLSNRVYDLAFNAWSVSTANPILGPGAHSMTLGAACISMYFLRIFWGLLFVTSCEHCEAISLQCSLRLSCEKDI